MSWFPTPRERDAARRLADFLFTPDYLWERLITAPYDGLPSALHQHPDRVILGTMPQHGERTRFMLTHNWNRIERFGLIIGLKRIFPSAIPCYFLHLPAHIALEGGDRVLYALLERCEVPDDERCCPECGGSGWVILDSDKPPASEQCELCRNARGLRQP